MGVTRKTSAVADATRRLDVLARLSKAYPNAHCALDHKTPFELLVATVLSAQCTDVRVNKVTPALFAEAPTAVALDAMADDRLRHLIRSINFFNNKTKALKGLARRLVLEFGGEVPRDMKSLLTLRGVARKTANVVLGNAFGIASGVVVDTHVGRLSGRLGLSNEKDPKKIEADLTAWVPQDAWIRLSHELIDHGRAICSARKPDCASCFLFDLCPSAQALTKPSKTRSAGGS